MVAGEVAAGAAAWTVAGDFAAGAAAWTVVVALATVVPEAVVAPAPLVLAAATDAVDALD